MSIIQENIDNNRFVITNMFDHEDGVIYWSNEDGWIEELAAATFFDLDEVARLNLPINGAWLPVSRANCYI